MADSLWHIDRTIRHKPSVKPAPTYNRKEGKETNPRDSNFVTVLPVPFFGAGMERDIPRGRLGVLSELADTCV